MRRLAAFLACLVALGPLAVWAGGWTTGTGRGGSTVIVEGAAGANTDVQYNSGGAFAGSASLTFTNSIGRLTATSLAAASLTATQVLFAGTGGVLHGDPDLAITFGPTVLSFNGAFVLPAYPDTSIPFMSGTLLNFDNASFVWDYDNSVLGIGTNNAGPITSTALLFGPGFKLQFADATMTMSAAGSNLQLVNTNNNGGITQQAGPSGSILFSPNEGNVVTYTADDVGFHAPTSVVTPLVLSGDGSTALTIGDATNNGNVNITAGQGGSWSIFLNPGAVNTNMALSANATQEFFPDDTWIVGSSNNVVPGNRRPTQLFVGTGGIVSAGGYKVASLTGINQNVAVCTGVACASTCTLHITGGIITSATGTCP